MEANLSNSWLILFCPFITEKTLHLPKNFALFSLILIKSVLS